MSDRDFGVTEVLAGAPELIRRFEQATPTQRAILNAAIDARRLGLQGPLTAQNLSALARASMTDPHAGQALFARAMDELTEKRRATAPLIPVRRRDGQALGYTVADYLLQRATAERRAVPVNARMWDALIACELDASDTFRLGSSVEHRLLLHDAISLYRRAASFGDGPALDRLAFLLDGRGDLEQEIASLRSDATGHPAAKADLADRLAARGAHRLTERADAGDYAAAGRLAEVLALRGDLAELTRRGSATRPRRGGPGPGRAGNAGVTLPG